MDIWNTIRSIIDLVESESDSNKTDKEDFLILLDSLAFQIHSIKPENEFKGSEIPENDYDQIRHLVEKRFPDLGHYNRTSDVTINIAETTITVGDTIDDLTDLINDLKHVMWSYHNESIDTAKWHLKDSYHGNWRWHLRNIQLYFHCLENEI